MSQGSVAELIAELHSAKRLFRPDWDKRIAAARRLGELRAGQAVGDLASVIRENENAELCQVAVQALGQIGNVQALDVLARHLQDRTRGELHSAACTALGQVGDERAVAALIAGWEPAGASQREAIGRALGRLGMERTVEPLVAALGRTSSAVREEAGKVLRQFADVAPRLVTVLGHEDGRVRDGARTLLAQMGAQAVPDLVAALGHADNRVRGGAVEALVQIGAPAMERLISTLTGGDERAIATATQVLLNIGQPAIRPLLSAVDDIPKAASVLRQMGEPAVKPLIAALREEATRAQAASLLVEMGAPVTEQLYAALDTSDESTRQAVVSVLTQITGRAAEQLADGAFGEFMMLQISEGLPFQHGTPWRKALPPLHRAVKLDPERADAHYFLAKVYAELSEPEKSVHHYERGLAARHQDFMTEEFTYKSRQRLIGHYVEQEQYADAIRHIEAWVETSPDNAEAHRQLGALYAMTDRQEEAIACFERAIALGEAEAEISGMIAMAAHEAYLHVIGQVQFEENDFGRILSLYKKASYFGERCLRSHPDDKAVTRFVPELRRLADEVGDVDRHEKAFVYNLRGVYAMSNAPTAGNPLLAAVMANAPEDMRATMTRVGKAVLTDDAIPAFQAALRLKPDYGGARYRLAEVYEQLGRHREALAMLEEGIRLSPDFWPLYFTLGDIYKNHMDNYDAAIRAYQQGLAINPSWAAGHRVLGYCYAAADQAYRAVPCFRKAVDLDPADAEAHLGLTLAYMQTEQEEKAVFHLQRAVALGHPQAKNLYQRLQSQMRRY